MPEEEVIVDPEVVDAEGAEEHPEESAASATAETTETPKSEQEQQDKKSAGKQKRIEELTRERHLAKAEAEFWKSKVLGTTEKPKAEAAQPAKEPSPADYKTVEEYLKAVRAYDREQMRAEIRSEVTTLTKEQEERAEASILQAEWSEREAQVSEAHEDYKDTTQTALETLGEAKGPAKAAIAHAIQYSDAGPALLYHLGQNPELIEELAEMPPARALLALGRLEASLETKEPGAKAAPHTRAPKPPTPVKGGKSSDPTELTDSLDPDVWRKRFMKRMAKAN